MDTLGDYQKAETNWLMSAGDYCSTIQSELLPRWSRVSNAWARVSDGRSLENPVTSLTNEYLNLERQARGASEAMFKEIAAGLPDQEKTRGLFAEIARKLQELGSDIVRTIVESFSRSSPKLAVLDPDCVVPSPGQAEPQFARRWSLYQQSCDLAQGSFDIQDSDVGSRWKRYDDLRSAADGFRSQLTAYTGAYARSVTNVCIKIAGEAEKRLRQQYVADYIFYVSNRLQHLPAKNLAELTNAVAWTDRVQLDLSAYQGEQSQPLGAVRGLLAVAATNMVNQYAAEWANQSLGRLAFPVLLSSSGRQMDAREVLAFKRDTDAFRQELQDPVWARLPRTPLLERLQQAPAFEVVRALVADAGAVDSLKFWFVPPVRDDVQGRDILSVFRVAQIEFAGSSSGWKDLTRASVPVLVHEGSLGSGLTLRFRKLAGDAASEQVPVQVQRLGAGSPDRGGTRGADWRRHGVAGADPVGGQGAGVERGCRL